MSKGADMTADRANEPILLRCDEGAKVTLTLNRPQQFNALSEALLEALALELEAIAKDARVRCVVLAGAGKAFCAGHDLKEMRANPSVDYYRALFGKCSDVMMAIAALPVPVVAMVQGVATAAGCQLVAACDLAVAADTARFAVSGVNLGLFCSTPSVALSRAILPKRAFDMLVTGKFIDAPTALDWGLINEVAPETGLDAAVAGKVDTILTKNAAAIRYGKAMFGRQLRMPLAEAYAFAGDVMAQNMMEESTQEDIARFLEKRSRAPG
jgi:enoyl-CoA hydratase/carnithine racemase